MIDFFTGTAGSNEPAETSDFSSAVNVEWICLISSGSSALWIGLLLTYADTMSDAHSKMAAGAALTRSLETSVEIPPLPGTREAIDPVTAERLRALGYGN